MSDGAGTREQNPSGGQNRPREQNPSREQNLPREHDPSRERILSREVFIRGANRPFGDLTLDDARARAEELRAVSGWGPTVRVVPVAHAWRELAIAMERAGAQSVSELDGEILSALAERLWVVLPGGPMMS